MVVSDHNQPVFRNGIALFRLNSSSIDVRTKEMEKSLYITWVKCVIGWMMDSFGNGGLIIKRQKRNHMELLHSHVADKLIFIFSLNIFIK
jgi:hypothetical protein